MSSSLFSAKLIYYNNFFSTSSVIKYFFPSLCCTFLFLQCFHAFFIWTFFSLNCVPWLHGQIGQKYFECNNVHTRIHTDTDRFVLGRNSSFCRWSHHVCVYMSTCQIFTRPLTCFCIETVKDLFKTWKDAGIFAHKYLALKSLKALKKLWML